ncbi:MAG: helix-turn-helix transcriptional regulator [Ruminococcus sp.]|nr:helix-turn-helix transcriptional regulator [Ruminococcus sp.]
MYNSQETVNRIKKLAREKNISMEHLRSRCELGINTISQCARSTYGFKAKNLYNISEVLDCSVDYLLGKTDEVSVNAGTIIKADELNGTIVTGDVKNNHNTHITNSPFNDTCRNSPSKDTLELVSLIESLPLVKKAQAILMITKLIEEN